MSLRLVNLGLPKSGTTTLSEALRKTGWRVADHKLRRSDTDDPLLAGSFTGRQIYEGYFETGNPLARLGGFDALAEISVLHATNCLWPQCDYAVLRAMRAENPQLRLVATWRPASEISDSMRRWNNLGTDRLPAGAIPGLPKGFGSAEAQRLRWIEGHYAMLRDLFGDDPRFLELPMAAADARDRLSAFIGEPVAWWGRANVNEKNPKRGAA